MKSITKNLRGIAFAICALTGLLSQGYAAPSISVDPASKLVLKDDQFSVDIVASGLTGAGGLGSALGGFSFLLSFNDSVLQGDGYSLDPALKLSPLDDQSFGFDGGDGSPLDVFAISTLLPADLDPDLDSIVLATITFKAIGNAGNRSPLTLYGANFSDSTGEVNVEPTANNGLVCIVTREDLQAGVPCRNDVPEPAGFLLVATGLGLLALRRRRS